MLSLQFLAHFCLVMSPVHFKWGWFSDFLAAWFQKESDLNTKIGLLLSNFQLQWLHIKGQEFWFQPQFYLLCYFFALWNNLFASCTKTYVHLPVTTRSVISPFQWLLMYNIKRFYINIPYTLLIILSNICYVLSLHKIIKEPWISWIKCPTQYLSYKALFFQW